jgi:serine/threonine-protein phosphatase Stp1
VTPFRIEDTSASHVGNVRRQNEDSHFSAHDHAVWLVADGMGGHENGKMASETLAAAVGAARLPDEIAAACEALSAAIGQANLAIYEQGRQLGVQMGTTAVALVLRSNAFGVLWAGDSRAYVFRDGTLIQLTRDHTQVEDLVERGLLSREDAADHPMKHVLSRAVGVQEALLVDAICDRVQPRDVFLLCTDGLHGVVEDAEIAAILRQRGPAGAEALVAASLARGGPDNVTVTLVAISEPTLLVLNGARP